MKIKDKIRPLIILGVIVLIAAVQSLIYFHQDKNLAPETLISEVANSLTVGNKGLGIPIRHIFFHSLIVYPQLALADKGNISGYRANMITVDQFKEILNELYAHNFILINSDALYSFDEDGKIHSQKLIMPEGKKPLILSIDDLSYYSYMKNGGFADRLVVENGIVRTRVKSPQGNEIVTDDGDIVPIVDAFVKEHPDFSLNGAKGIIALTGFEGILGYRTNWSGDRGKEQKKLVEPVVEALKQNGWIFGSHSFSHNQGFREGTISTSTLALDISKWQKNVEPLVGKTNIFIGPFGQVFKEGDPRREVLLNAGFKVLYGVGMDGYFKFFNDHFVMNRADIDEYRITHNAKELFNLFGLSVDQTF